MRTKTTTLKNGTRVTKLVEGPPKEWRIQSAAVRALRAMPEFGRKFTLAADMAAHKRRPQDATIAKATGLVSGDHDLRVLMEGGRLGLIEYKVETSLSATQRERHALLHRLGFTMQAVVKATSEADAAVQTVCVVKGWLAANDDAPTKHLVRTAKRYAETVVSNSCGCIFCDIGMKPVNGEHEVHSEGVSIPCPLAANDNQRGE